MMVVCLRSSGMTQSGTGLVPSIRSVRCCDRGLEVSSAAGDGVT